MVMIHHFTKLIQMLLLLDKLQLSPTLTFNAYPQGIHQAVNQVFLMLLQLDVLNILEYFAIKQLMEELGMEITMVVCCSESGKLGKARLLSSSAKIGYYTKTTIVRLIVVDYNELK